MKIFYRHSRESGNPAASDSEHVTQRHKTRRRAFWIPAFAGMTLLLGLPAFAAPAAPACYSPAEFEAENMLRLHSELMVITVTCRVGSQGEDLVSAYTGFTKRNITDLHNAEKTMTHYYNNHGGRGQDKLDVLRTKLGNEFGQKIADMSAQPFCDAYRNKVLTFNHAPADDIHSEVQRMQISYKPYVKPCAPTQQVARNRN